MATRGSVPGVPNGDLEEAIKSLGFLTADGAARKITFAWRQDNDKLFWCRGYAIEKMGAMWPFGDTTLMKTIALDRWFALDPLWQENWTTQNVDVPTFHASQQTLIGELSDEPFTVWQPNAEALVADVPYSWESEEQSRNRNAAWIQYLSSIKLVQRYGRKLNLEYFEVSKEPLLFRDLVDGMRPYTQAVRPDVDYAADYADYANSYDLASWSANKVSALTRRLDEKRIPWFWRDSYLLVYAEHKQIVDEMLQASPS